MKKTAKLLTVLMLSSVLLFQTSCIGSFSLTGKVLDFNRDLGNKFVSEAVFIAFCIIPVYEVATFVDAVVLNLVEFWTGSNPLALEEGQQIEKIVKKDGETYKFTATTNQVKVEVLEGENVGKEVVFSYDTDNQTLAMLYEGQSTKLMELNEAEQMATLYYPHEKKRDILITMDTDKNELTAAAFQIGLNAFAMN